MHGSPLRLKRILAEKAAAVKIHDENKNVSRLRKSISPNEENAKNENEENEEKEKKIRDLLDNDEVDVEDVINREEERRIKARLAKSNRRGSLTYLMEGYTDNMETINSVIAKLYKKADFVLSKAQRGIIFLDGMDRIGMNTNCSDLAKRQVLYPSVAWEYNVKCLFSDPP